MSKDLCSASESPDNLNCAFDLSNVHPRPFPEDVLENKELCELYRSLLGELPTEGVEGVVDVEEVDPLELDRDFGGAGATGAFICCKGTANESGRFAGRSSVLCGYFTCPVGSQKLTGSHET